MATTSSPSSSPNSPAPSDGWSTEIAAQDSLRGAHHNLELFFHCPKFSGTVTTDRVAGPGRLDARYIKEARFVPRGELDRLSVYPPELKDAFWRDLAEGFSETRRLGLQSAFPEAPEGD